MQTDSDISQSIKEKEANLIKAKRELDYAQDVLRDAALLWAALSNKVLRAKKEYEKTLDKLPMRL